MRVLLCSHPDSYVWNGARTASSRTAPRSLSSTLLDTLADLAAATNYTLEKNGFPKRTTDEVRMFVGNGIRKLIERAVPQGTSVAVQEQVFADFNVYYKAHCADTTCAYPGVLELLQEARSLGCQTAIVSNKADYGVQELAKQYFPGLLDAACGHCQKARSGYAARCDARAWS